MIWSAEYWAKKGDVQLYTVAQAARRAESRRTAAAGAVPCARLFVTRRVFDLDVPGHGEYSLMNVFARWGYDVWTMDHEATAVRAHRRQFRHRQRREDLKAAMPVIVKETGQQKVHFIGESSGAAARGLYATDRA